MEFKCLEKEILEKMLKDNMGEYFYATPVDASEATKNGSKGYGIVSTDIIVTAKKWSVLCSCGGSGIEKQPICPKCGRGLHYSVDERGRTIDRKILVTNAYKKKLEEMHFNHNGKPKRSYWSGNILFEYKGRDNEYERESSFYTRANLLRTYYVREKLDGKIGIDILRCTISVGVENEAIVMKTKYDCFTEVIPGEKVVAYKYTKARGKEEISLFDAFHITSDNIMVDENVYFEGAYSMIDFVFSNFEFAKRTGLDKLILNYKGSIPENSLFLLYLYLLSEYPVIEFLVKQGYYHLIFSMMESICNSYKRTSIQENVNNLSYLLNQTTKGSNSLTIPSHIAEYCQKKGSDINEYKMWASINELEPLSPERFSEFIASEEFQYLNYYHAMETLPNIMKYGYTLRKTVKYIMKQFSMYYYGNMFLSTTSTAAQKVCYPIQSIVNLWKDYLEMCELLDVEAAKFPKNIKSVHDDMMTAKLARQNEIIDKKIDAIASQYDNYVTTSKYLDIVVPRCTKDFIDEGVAQHNCVAGYSQRVADGHCRIFFIRKKDALDQSYITAECTKNGLGQLFYRNNQPVNDYTEKEYAKAFCKFILSKPWEPGKK